MYLYASVVPTPWQLCRFRGALHLFHYVAQSETRPWWCHAVTSKRRKLKGVTCRALFEEIYDFSRSRCKEKP